MFEETQRFRQSWVWAILLACLGLSLYAVYTTWGEPQATASILALLLMLAICGLMYIIRLETAVNPQGIYYQLYPLHHKMRFIGWEHIKSAEVREYSPLREYGGWGLRHSAKHGRAYNVAGNHGLQLLLKSGEQILLGSQRPDEMQRAVEKFRPD